VVIKEEFLDISTLEDEDNLLPRNVGNRLSSDTASYPRRREFSVTAAKI
jgi:hypothetical protein